MKGCVVWVWVVRTLHNWLKDMGGFPNSGYGVTWKGVYLLTKGLSLWAVLFNRGDTLLPRGTTYSGDYLVRKPNQSATKRVIMLRWWWLSVMSPAPVDVSGGRRDLKTRGDPRVRE